MDSNQIAELMDSKEILVWQHRDAAGVENSLQRQTLQGGDPTLDCYFDDGDASRPPIWLIEMAAAMPQAGWILEPEDPHSQASPGAANVRGAWEVDQDGQLTDRFQPNPAYRPACLADPDKHPLSQNTNILRLFPEAARDDIEYAIRKLGSPKLVADALFGTDFTYRIHSELVEIIIRLACGPVDDNWEPLPAMLWFEAIADYMVDYSWDSIIDPPPRDSDQSDE